LLCRLEMEQVREDRVPEREEEWEAEAWVEAEARAWAAWEARAPGPAPVESASAQAAGQPRSTG